jgi:short-subunit dehydrogenase
MTTECSTRRSRVVIVTGASSGLGKATALLFARHDWSVGLIARGVNGLRATRDEIHRRGGRAAIGVADVGDRHALEQAAASVEAELGEMDVWVNVAGSGTYAFFDEGSAEDFDRVLLTKLTGSVNGTRIALRRMVPRDRGTVVQVGSAIAYRGIPLQSAYTTTKWGLRGLHEAVRAELAHKGSAVVLSLVNPPGMDTPFFSHAQSELRGAVPHVPSGAYAPDDTAEAILLAATSRRREWNVGAASVALLLADHFLPKTPMDWIVGKLGVAGQRTTSPKAVTSRDPTLHAPSEHVSGTRGVFGDEAIATSLVWQATKRPALTAAVFLAAAVGVSALVARRQSPPRIR